MKNKIQDLRFGIPARGMSLIEILIVITIFAVLGILITQSVVLTLQGSRKSESMIRARENLDYSLSIIEREIRGASSVTPCTGSPVTTISYLDQYGITSSFSCVNPGGDDSFIASGSARLTTDAVKVTACSFVCTAGTMNTPTLITVDVALKEASVSGVQSASVSATTQIYLRNF